MFTRWLTFTAFLAGSANPERAAIGQGALTVTPTCRVKGQPEAELILNCGDGKKAGVVDYWHTPFGDFHSPNFHSKLDPVFMHHDGSLVVSNASHLHSGLYYCLLQHTEGTTLWPYELHVVPNHQRNHEEGSRSDVFRFRRDVWSEEGRQAAGVSDGQFTAAVVASVLLTFVLGFSIGALSRSHVLRCLGSVTKRLKSPRRQQCPTEVTMATLPPMCDNQAFQMEQVTDDDSANGPRISTTSSPPAKPQRSFRHKRKEEVTTTYLEGCDYKKEEEEEEEEKKEEDNYKGCEEEEGEFRSFYISGLDGRNETETDEDKCSKDREEEESREEKKECRREEEEEEEEGGEQENGSKEIGEEKTSSEEEEEEGGEQENRSKEIGEEKRSSEEEEEEEEEAARGNKERWRDEKMEEEGGGDGGRKGRSEEDEETDESRESEQSSGETDDEETGERNQEDMTESGVGGGEGEEGEEGGGGVGRKPGRRSRIIRLYQYNEDGERYGHLPAPASDPTPAPRLRQRSLSLTRLSAIMAAASAGPLDASGETEGEERKEKAHFHMEI